MWLNKQSRQTAPIASSGRVETSSAPQTVGTISPTGKVAQPASCLGVTLKVKGEISGNEDLQIDGKVEGPISVGQHRLTLGQNAQVTGGLAAREIVISGKVEGNLNASERIDIRKDASVIGDLTTRRIAIEDGAHFKGSIEIRKSDQQIDSKPDNSFLAQTASQSA